MSHTFARRFAIAALSLPLLLAGCADDEPVPKVQEPTAAPTPVASTSASPAAPVEPTLPPEAEGKGIEAAEAFVRHYYAMVDHARRTGDTAALREAALPTCATCNEVVNIIDRIRDREGSIEGGDQTVRRIELGQLRGVPGAATFRGNATITSTRQVITGYGDPLVDGTYPPGDIRVSVLVVKGKQGWRFAEWFVIS
ncbi:MAG: hypothetical protein JWN68_1143 [Nocardioides sp.]|uniref:DUF6318 family protein n=1 Tax=Nocardioides sp. TaxID=35761 RepID=UPI002623BE63|nr:DUF6318 family protein [Nocardioides sp.]MCW2833190.1 hypothetical protein [Nocardioides sp.]